MNKHLLFFIFLLVPFFSLKMEAQLRPNAFFGQFGIQYQSDFSNYQKYVGKTVMYVNGLNINQDFLETETFNGELNKEYIINKIKADDKKVTISLIEKGGKQKAKLTAGNLMQRNYYLGQKYAYNITKISTVPLLFVDEFNQAKEEYIGKKYTHGGRVYNIVDFKVLNFHIVATYKSKESDETFLSTLADMHMMKYVGKVFKHPKVKATYEIVEYIGDFLSDDNRSKFYLDKKRPFVRVVNCLTNEYKKVPLESASEECFYDDLDGSYFATLDKVERTSSIQSFPYNNKITTTSVEGVTKFSFQDSILSVLIAPTPKNFVVELKNNSKTTMKVIWDEAIFVNSEGLSSRVLHKGIRYIDKDKSMPATSILRGTKIVDVICPTNHIYFSSLFDDWDVKNLLPVLYQKEMLEPIRLMIPVEFNNIRYEYILEFKVTRTFKYPDRLN